MVSGGEAEDICRWGGRAAPTNDARERSADIPNGERALARFSSWHEGVRGTLYVSRSYAVFASARARGRVLVPLCGVSRVRAARGIELASDNVVFTFALTRRDDLRCALRLLSVLAQRARSGAHLTPQPKDAALAIAASAGPPLPARGLDFEPRSRHRRRSSKAQRRRARAPAPGPVRDCPPPAESAPDLGFADDELTAPVSEDDDDTSTVTLASAGHLPAYGTNKKLADAKRKLLSARDKLVDARNKLAHVEKRVRAVGGRAGAKAGAIARTVAKSEVGRWSLEHALDIAMCVVALIAVIVAVVTLRM
eukprot:IDg14967t1